MSDNAAISTPSPDAGAGTPVLQCDECCVLTFDLARLAEIHNCLRAGSFRLRHVEGLRSPAPVSPPSGSTRCSHISEANEVCPVCEPGLYALAQKVTSHPAPPSGSDEGTSIDALVDGFATALRTKLHAAEQKYGWNGAWERAPAEALRADLIRHLSKGDPLDVAAFCAFLWKRGISTHSLCTVCGGVYGLTPRCPGCLND